MGTLEISKHPSYNLKQDISIGLKDIVTSSHYFQLALQNVCEIVGRINIKAGYLRDITNLPLANSRT